VSSGQTAKPGSMGSGGTTLAGSGLVDMPRDESQGWNALKLVDARARGGCEKELALSFGQGSVRA
jgi:hypothetical protein